MKNSLKPFKEPKNNFGYISQELELFPLFLKTMFTRTTEAQLRQNYKLIKNVQIDPKVMKKLNVPKVSESVRRNTAPGFIRLDL